MLVCTTPLSGGELSSRGTDVCSSNSIMKMYNYLHKGIFIRGVVGVTLWDEYFMNGSRQRCNVCCYLHIFKLAVIYITSMQGTIARKQFCKC